MVQREFTETRQVDIDFMEAHFHIGKSRLGCEALQVLFGWDLSRRAEADGGFGRYELSERVADGMMISADALPYTERKTAAAVERAAHLPQRERLVGKELESLLTQNHIEARILQSQVERAALEPFDRCADRSRKRARDPDHSRVQINTDHASTGTDALGRDAGDDASPTSNVQHALAGCRAGGVDQRWCPGAEDISGGAALVALGGLVAELELFARVQIALARLALHLCRRERIALIRSQAFRLRQPQLFAHDIGAEHHRHHLVSGMPAAHALAAHAAVG